MNRKMMKSGIIAILCGFIGVFNVQCAQAEDTTVIPSDWTTVRYNDGVRYSQWVIDSRISDFRANAKARGFNAYDVQGRQIKGSLGASVVLIVLLIAIIIKNWKKPEKFDCWAHAEELATGSAEFSVQTDASDSTAGNPSDSTAEKAVIDDSDYVPKH